MPPPLFQTLLGPAFDLLPGPVRRLHAAALPQRVVGRVQVHAVGGRAARAVAAAMRLPAGGGESPIAVEIRRHGSGECWTREFPGRRMRSTLAARAGLLCERFGPVTLRFRLHGSAQGIEWEPVAASLFGLPLPRRTIMGIRAREWVEDGSYCFLAEGGLPLLGVVTAYRGRLQVT